MFNDKKILFNTTPKKVKTLNCYDNNIIADISRFFQRDYQISLLGEFDFTYRNIDEINNLLDYNDIFTGDILYVPYMLSKFVGISLEHIETKEKDNLIMFIERISSYIDTEFPVGVGMDSYYLPWNPQYNILHRIHYFLIIGLDLQENIFYCKESQKDGVYREYEIAKKLGKKIIPVGITGFTSKYIFNLEFKNIKDDETKKLWVDLDKENDYSKLIDIILRIMNKKSEEKEIRLINTLRKKLNIFISFQYNKDIEYAKK